MKLLPYAALILKHIIKLGKPKTIVFSASGVREGVLYSQLDEEQMHKDPLICGSIEMMTRMLRKPEYGYELASWMKPLFANDDSISEERLRLAACIMSEISCYENTEYRAELAYRKILDSSLTGLNHKDRLFIAKSLYFRYSTYPDDNILSTMGTLLNSKKVQNAQVVGAAMRLARSLSCSSDGVLEKTKLQVNNNTISLAVSDDKTQLLGESVKKRVKQLAELLGMEAKVI